MCMHGVVLCNYASLTSRLPRTHSKPPATTTTPSSHRSACAFFDVARFAQFQPDMLIGADAQFFAGLPLAQQYLYSIFWALSTLSSAEFNSDAPGTVTATVSATFRALLFMAFNIGKGLGGCGSLVGVIVCVGYLWSMDACAACTYKLPNTHVADHPSSHSPGCICSGHDNPARGQK